MDERPGADVSHGFHGADKPLILVEGDIRDLSKERESRVYIPWSPPVSIVKGSMVVRLRELMGCTGLGKVNLRSKNESVKKRINMI